jgi:hypothetical protein
MQGQLARSIHEAVTHQHVLQLFDGNHVTLFDLSASEAVPIEFNLPLQEQLTVIIPNPHLPQLVCFKNDDRYCIVNLNSYRVVKKGEGRFFWCCYDEYLLVRDGQINLHSLTEEISKLTY